MTTYVINFSGHPLTPRVVAHLQPCVEVKVSFNADFAQETLGQVVRLINQTEKMLEAKGGALNGTVPTILVLPAVTEYAAVIIAEVHGRLGGYPRILSQRRDVDGTWNLFADSANLGVIDLERIRKESRGRRKLEKPEEVENG